MFDVHYQALFETSITRVRLHNIYTFYVPLEIKEYFYLDSQNSLGVAIENNKN